MSFYKNYRSSQDALVQVNIIVYLCVQYKRVCVSVFGWQQIENQRMANTKPTGGSGRKLIEWLFGFLVCFVLRFGDAHVCVIVGCVSDVHGAFLLARRW